MITREISNDEWIIVEKRLDSMPDNMKIGFLSNLLTKDQLKKHVKGRTEVGITYALMQLDFIAWLLKQSRII